MSVHLARDGAARRRAGSRDPRLFFCQDGEVVEAYPPDVVIDVLELLAGGATDEVVATLGDEGAEALGWLGELELVG